jgi:hypothetical protein
VDDDDKVVATGQHLPWWQMWRLLGQNMPLGSGVFPAMLVSDNVACRTRRLICLDMLAEDEADTSWMRPGTLDETAAQRFARYTEGFSVEDEDAPPLPMVCFKLSS